MSPKSGPWLVALIVVGALSIAAGAAVGFSVLPTFGGAIPHPCNPCTTPTLSVAPVNAHAAGFNGTFYASGNANPSGVMTVTSGYVQIVGLANVPVPIKGGSTGGFNFAVPYAFKSPGIYSLYATFNATAGSTHYMAHSLTVTHLVVTAGSGANSTGSGSACSSPGTPCPRLTVAFTYSARNLTLTFHDTSSAANATLLPDSWSFGDGSTFVSGLTVSHTYSTPGSYLVTLFASATPTAILATGQTMSGSAAQNVTVCSGCNGGGGTNNTTAPPTAFQFTASPTALALIAFGAVTLILQFVPVLSGQKWGFLIAAAAAVVTFVVV